MPAFALGAEGVQVGTRFLTAEECCVAQAYKDKVIAAKDSDTIVTGRAGGHPVRGLKNKLTREIRQMEAQGMGDSAEAEERLAGSLRRAVQGDVDNGSMMAGQSACLVHDCKPAVEIVIELVSQAEKWAAFGLQEMADKNATRAWK